MVLTRFGKIWKQCTEDQVRFAAAPSYNPHVHLKHLCPGYAVVVARHWFPFKAHLALWLNWSSRLLNKDNEIMMAVWVLWCKAVTIHHYAFVSTLILNKLQTKFVKTVARYVRQKQETTNWGRALSCWFRCSIVGMTCTLRCANRCWGSITKMFLDLSMRWIRHNVAWATLSHHKQALESPFHTGLVVLCEHHGGLMVQLQVVPLLRWRRKR